MQRLTEQTLHPFISSSDLLIYIYMPEEQRASEVWASERSGIQGLVYRSQKLGTLLQALHCIDY